MGDWVYWLSWSLSIALACAMVYLTWWALFHDRPNGRRRCPRCWYDLSYAPEPPAGAPFGVTCSECGHTARRLNQLYRTRRRYAHATLAVLVCLGIAIFAQDRTAESGWSATMPTRVLLLSLPFVDRQSSFFLELGGRAEGNQLSDKHWLMLMNRCARGDRFAPPPDEAWREKYGRLVLRSRSQLVPVKDDENARTEVYGDAELPLFSLPCIIEVETPRDRWPQDEVVWIALSLQEWWPAESEVRLVITPRGADAPSRTVHYLTDSNRYGVVALPLFKVSDGLDQVALDIEAFHRRGSQSPWNRAGALTQAVTLLAAHPDEKLVESVTDDADERVAQAIRQIFRGQVVRWPAGESPVRFSYMPYLTTLQEFEALGIGASLELRRDEVVARRIELWWLAGESPPEPPYPVRRRFSRNDEVRFNVVYEDLSLLAQLDENDPRWRMRIRGEERIALRVPGAKRYWAGELDLPITVADRTGTAPRRGVRIE